MTYKFRTCLGPGSVDVCDSGADIAVLATLRAQNPTVFRAQSMLCSAPAARTFYFFGVVKLHQEPSF